MTEGYDQPKGTLSLQTIAMPADTNWGGSVFGGWLVSQMDLAGAIHVERVSHGRCATISIHEMTFLIPVSVGDVVSCYTDVIKIGNTSIQVHIEVWSINNHRAVPVKVTEGIFTFVAIESNGAKRTVPDDVRKLFELSKQ
ncbi:MAG: acyl-CoA thioesterase [Acinetobacter sp.]|jgi:acyl-CoA thioesterase YciA